MSVNDVVVCGAEPVVFLDYFATSRLRQELAERVIAGIAEGCLRAGCALIGGETAELPGFYGEGEYDLAGFCVGVVEKSRILDGSRVRAGDAVLGLASSGLHSNGYSLARKVFGDRPAGELLDLLLEPTRIYVKDCLALQGAVDVGAFAHVTGGGLPGNLRASTPLGATLTLAGKAPASMRYAAIVSELAKMWSVFAHTCRSALIASRGWGSVRNRSASSQSGAFTSSTCRSPSRRAAWMPLVPNRDRRS